MNPSPFAGTPRTPRGHFLLHYNAAVYRLVHFLRRLSPEGDEGLRRAFARFPFLGSYFARVQAHLPEGISWEASLPWWERAVRSWEQDGQEHLPLRALAEEVGLDFLGRLALLLAGLVEEDSRFGAVFSWLQEPSGHRRPTLETIGQVLVPETEGGPDPQEACRLLLAAGVVRVADGDAPRSEWLPRIPPLVWAVLRGDDFPSRGYRHLPPESFPAVGELVLPDELVQRLRQVPNLLTAGIARALVLRGREGSERLEAAGAVARALGRGLLPVNGADLRPDPAAEPLGVLCTLTRSLPVLCYDLGPGETADVPELPGYRGPVAVILGMDGGVRGPPVAGAVTLTLPTSGVGERKRSWQSALGGRAVRDLQEISERFRLPGGYIRQAATLAVAQAALRQGGAVEMDDVRVACRALNRQLLDTLAAPLEPEGSWDRLVVSEATGARLRELERRCRHRERLHGHLGPGFGAQGNVGVRALFSGPSGTGKTLAARVLAAVLGMDLYRVDLSAVVNKYIGETEKNLHRVLSRAEELDVILLLDEGDALLGSRTEVRSANDRYANLETNYLLQRLEHYEGIVLVTTNAVQHIDGAFQRRMDVVVHFVPPQAAERWHIWRLHLPAGHAVEEDYLEEVCLRCALHGGQIRSAALHAALLAVDGGGGPVTRRHLEEAVRSEYRKAGATCPLGDGTRGEPAHGGMARLLDALAP